MNSFWPERIIVSVHMLYGHYGMTAKMADIDFLISICLRLLKCSTGHCIRSYYPYISQKQLPPKMKSRLYRSVRRLYFLAVVFVSTIHKGANSKIEASINYFYNL